MIVRLIVYAILFYLLWKFLRAFVRLASTNSRSAEQPTSHSASHLDSQPKTQTRMDFSDGDIEDAKFEDITNVK
ncbi:MAG: hypothetical protein ACP5ON_02310 [Bacteroidota bacterium]